MWSSKWCASYALVFLEAPFVLFDIRERVEREVFLSVDVQTPPLMRTMRCWKLANRGRERCEDEEHGHALPVQPHIVGLWKRDPRMHGPVCEEETNPASHCETPVQPTGCQERSW